MMRVKARSTAESGELHEGGKLPSKGIILAVDDVPESLVMLTDTLAAEGYDVRPADSGELALASLEATKPDLILLDIRMSGMDGFEVCRRLKARSESRDIPLMFISGISEISERVEGLKLRCGRFRLQTFPERRTAGTHQHSLGIEQPTSQAGTNGGRTNGRFECRKRAIVPGTCGTTACRAGAARK